MSEYQVYYPEQSRDGLRGKRIIAYCLDVAVVLLCVLALTVALFILGFVTFGLAWILLAMMFGGMTTIVGILYAGLSIGSAAQATPGMQAVGLRFTLDNGEAPGFVYGAVHLVLFYLSVSFLTPAVLLVTFINKRKRLLHDIVLGVDIRFER